MATISRLRLLRGLLAFNLTVFVVVIVDSIIRAKAPDGPVTTHDTFVLTAAGAALIAYAAGVTGLWFDKRWGRIAFCVFLVLDIVTDEPGETTRLALVLSDMHTLSSGLILGLAFFGQRDDRGRAVGDVFS